MLLDPIAMALGPLSDSLSLVGIFWGLENSASPFLISADPAVVVVAIVVTVAARAYWISAIHVAIVSVSDAANV